MYKNSKREIMKQFQIPQVCSTSSKLNYFKCEINNACVNKWQLINFKVFEKQQMHIAIHVGFIQYTIQTLLMVYLCFFMFVLFLFLWEFTLLLKPFFISYYRYLISFSMLKKRWVGNGTARNFRSLNYWQSTFSYRKNEDTISAVATGDPPPIGTHALPHPIW